VGGGGKGRSGLANQYLDTLYMYVFRFRYSLPRKNNLGGQTIAAVSKILPVIYKSMGFFGLSSK
jgi:hypothetical protein